MSYHKIILAWLFFTVFLIDHSSADLIILKNGRRLEGAIVKTTDSSITVDIGIGETTLNRSDIKSIKRNEENNAAIYYLRAGDLANYNNVTVSKNKIAKFEEAKFRMAQVELEELLNNNKRCFREIEKALATKECDFYFKDKDGYANQENRQDNQRKVMYLHSLLLLKSRYYEGLKNFDQAVDSCLSALTFALQLSQGRDPDLQAAAILIEKNTYPILLEYLDSKNIDPKIFGKVFTYIDNYEKEHFSAKEFIESDKEAFIRPFNSFARDITRWAKETVNLDAGVRADAQKFAEDLLREGNGLADKYYGNYIKAATTDANNDWELAAREYRELLNTTKPTGIEDEIDFSVFVHNAFGKVEDYSKKDPKAIVVTILSTQLPSCKVVVDRYRENCKGLKKIKALAAGKMKARN